VEAGRLLLKVKEEVGHGNFIKWIEENFKGSERVARKYMRLAKAADQNRIDPDEVSSLTEAENMLRDQDAEPTREEYEPEVEGEEYDFSSQEEYEEYDFGSQEEYEEWNDEAQGGAAQEPAPKKSRSRRDMKSTALTKVDEWIREVPGKERDRIRELRNYLDVYEEALNAKDAPPQRGPRDNGADVGKSALRGRSVGGPKDVVARLAPEMMEKAS
jgi:hypothetical protein